MDCFGNQGKKEILQNLTFFGYVFFVFSVCSIAGYNIFTGFMVLCVLLSIQNVNINALKRIKKIILCHLLFFSLLLLAALLSADGTIVYKTLKYISWTLPFWLIIIFPYICNFEKLYGYAIFMSLCVISIFALLLVNRQGVRVIGYFGKPTLLGTILGIILPATVLLTMKAFKDISNKYVKFLFSMICLLGIYTLFLSKTRGAIIGLIIGGIMLYLLLHQKSWDRFSLKQRLCIMFSIFFILVGTICILPNTPLHRSYDYERILLWKSSYAMWQDNPIYGIGFGNWHKIYPQYILPQAKEPDLPIPHNTIASFLSETGIIGGMGFLTYTIGTIIILACKISVHPANIYYQIAFWSFVTITCHGMVDTGLTNRFGLQLMSLILGVAFYSELYHLQKS